MKDYSQNQEYTFLKNYYEEHPPANKLLVDVGARYAKESNTYNLLLEGWKGIMIEPFLSAYRKLKEECRTLQAEVLNIAISDYLGNGQLIIHKEYGHNSMSETWREDTKTKHAQLCDVYPLDMILKSRLWPTDFELLSIDTEGLDQNILHHLLTQSPYRPHIIIVERESFEDFSDLEENGYHQITELGHNVIWERT